MATPVEGGAQVSNFAQLRQTLAGQSSAERMKTVTTARVGALEALGVPHDHAVRFVSAGFTVRRATDMIARGVSPEHAIQVRTLMREGVTTADAVELTQKGFTHDEALGVLGASRRVATSREARDAKSAELRLRFARWQVEHGQLDEFSA